MALMAFWQPALSLILKCIVMMITGKIKCLLACNCYHFFTETNGASKVKVGSTTDRQLGRCQ